MHSIIRNPLILRTLFLSDDVETYGSGFKRVFNECKKNNIETKYIIAREGFTFIFKPHKLNKSSFADYFNNKKYFSERYKNSIKECLEKNRNQYDNKIVHKKPKRF